MTVSYVKGSELADLTVTWQDSSGNAVDLSSGYTFTVKVGVPGSAASFTKTTGITGTTTGVSIAWATTAELSALAAGLYVLQIAANRTSDSKDRIQQFHVQIADAIT